LSLREINIKKEYRSLLDNIAREFYIPLLQQAISYKRAVGFFSSSALIEISKGISALVKNDGKIQLVASPFLSEEDISAIKRGYELRDNIVRNAVLRELREPTTEYESARLNLLANLISDGVLDIKIAFIEDEKQMGMYHEKMGIISDKEGNIVAFSGSMNESYTAMSLNYEAIDVFCSWKGESDRTGAKEAAFSSIWENIEPNIKIINFPELNHEIIKRYKVSKPNYSIDFEEYRDDKVEPKRYLMKTNIAKVPELFTFYQYQQDAIDEWERKGFRGIFDMATGTGKTYTGLGAVARLSDAVDGNLAVFIVAPFQHLVEQWIDDIKKFNMIPIVGYSASSQKNWKTLLENAVLDQKLRVPNKKFFSFVCTNATFSSSFVQSQIQKLKGNSLLVVDEAHNFGAESLRTHLGKYFQFRLALSATLERHNDEEGTAALYKYFGDKCIEYTLEQAIAENKLTPYKYYPIVTTLNEKELDKYTNLTYEIGKCIIKTKNGKVKLSEKGKWLALTRSRVVAAAEEKIQLIEVYITPYIDDKHILVYCGATKLLRDNEEFTTVDKEDIRQIDAVTNLLGNKLNMKVSQFTSKEDINERKLLKREFSEGDNLQVLIAIKCLDEGVNIPSIKVAFILASTTNPKEYIQRRGRVLRLAEGKKYAKIYDFITLPRPLDEVPSLTIEQLKKELTLVKNELNRGKEFARIALNMVEAEDILDDIKEAYGINDNKISFEEGYGNEK